MNEIIELKNNQADNMRSTLTGKVSEATTNNNEMLANFNLKEVRKISSLMELNAQGFLEFELEKYLRDNIILEEDDFVKSIEKYLNPDILSPEEIKFYQEYIKEILYRSDLLTSLINNLGFDEKKILFKGSEAVAIYTALCEYYLDNQDLACPTNLTIKRSHVGFHIVFEDINSFYELYNSGSEKNTEVKSGIGGFYETQYFDGLVTTELSKKALTGDDEDINDNVFIHEIQHQKLAIRSKIIKKEDSLNYLRGYQKEFTGSYNLPFRKKRDGEENICNLSDSVLMQIIRFDISEFVLNKVLWRAQDELLSFMLENPKFIFYKVDKTYDTKSTKHIDQNKNNHYENKLESWEDPTQHLDNLYRYLENLYGGNAEFISSAISDWYSKYLDSTQKSFGHSDEVIEKNKDRTNKIISELINFQFTKQYKTIINRAISAVVKLDYEIENDPDLRSIKGIDRRNYMKGVLQNYLPTDWPRIVKSFSNNKTKLNNFIKT